MRRHGLLLVVLAAMLFLAQPRPDRGLPAGIEVIVSITAMALIPGLLALIFYYRGLLLTSASLTSIGELAFPITAVTANRYLLGIRLTVSQIIGACVLVAAVTLLTFMGSTGSASSRARPMRYLRRMHGLKKAVELRGVFR